MSVGIHPAAKAVEPVIMSALATIRTGAGAVTLLLCAAVSAGAPPCLPAMLALSSAPVGKPVARNRYMPTLSTAAMHDGVAVYWHCRVPQGVEVYEVHGTPAAIARSGGLGRLQRVYAQDLSSTWSALDAAGHSCLDPSPSRRNLVRRADCHAFAASGADKGQRYLCVNPAVTDVHEARLCQHLVREIAAHWPH